MGLQPGASHRLHCLLVAGSSPVCAVLFVVASLPRPWLLACAARAVVSTRIHTTPLGASRTVSVVAMLLRTNTSRPPPHPTVAGRLMMCCVNAVARHSGR